MKFILLTLCVFIGLPAILRAQTKVGDLYYRDIKGRLYVSYGTASTPTSERTDYATLTKVTIPATVEIDGTSRRVTGVDADAFAYCKNLKQVELTQGLVYVGERAFKGTGLRSVVIPKGMQGLSAQSFADCADLEFVELGPDILPIAEGCFANCPKLQTLRSRTTRVLRVVQSQIFSSTPTTVYVPTGLAADYRTPSFFVGGADGLGGGHSVTNYLATANIVEMDDDAPTLAVQLPPQGGVTEGKTVYQSFYFPFNVSLAAGLKAYIVTGHSADHVITTELPSTEVIPAFTPVLLAGTAGSQYTLRVTSSLDGGDNPTNELMANPLPANINSTDNVWSLAYRNNETSPAFYRWAGSLPAGNVYLHLSDVSSSRLPLNGDGPSTGLSTLPSSHLTSSAVYDLQGRVVSSTRPGLKIDRNGRKWIVK
jgi:hypothetical protein